jgi:hypothetical protein
VGGDLAPVVEDNVSKEALVALNEATARERLDEFHRVWLTVGPAQIDDAAAPVNCR